MKKKFGFTLAEVLITLAIIGVVAAVTMPALMTDTKYQQIGTRLRKFVATTQNAALAYVAANDEFVPNNNDRTKEFLNSILLIKGDQTEITNDGKFVTLADNTQLRYYNQAGDVTNYLSTPYNTQEEKYGVPVAQLQLIPDVKISNGPDSYEFMLTTKGYVLPGSLTSLESKCARALWEANFKATAAMFKDTTQCKKSST